MINSFDTESLRLKNVAILSLGTKSKLVHYAMLSGPVFMLRKTNCIKYCNAIYGIILIEIYMVQHLLALQITMIIKLTIYQKMVKLIQFRFMISQFP